MRPWAVSACLHLAVLLLAVLWWPAPALSAPPPVRLSLAAAAPPRSATPVPEGTAPVLEGTAPVPEGIAPVPEGTAPVPEGTAPVPEGIAPVPEGIAPVPEGIAPVPEGTAPDSEGTAPVSEARLSVFQAPPYPSRLRDSGIEGEVEVGVEVDEAGKAARVWVVRGSGQLEFDRRALAAVRAARFIPAAIGERAVTDTTKVTVRFRLTS